MALTSSSPIQVHLEVMEYQLGGYLLTPWKTYKGKRFAMHFLSLPFDDSETDNPPALATEEAVEPGIPCMHFRRQGRIIATACFYPNRTALGSNWFDGERFRLLFHRKHLPDIRRQIEQGNVLSVADLLQIQARFRMSTIQPQSRRLYWGPAAGRHAIP